mgnify:CR=1 FL=1
MNTTTACTPIESLGREPVVHILPAVSLGICLIRKCTAKADHLNSAGANDGTHVTRSA